MMGVLTPESLLSTTSVLSLIFGIILFFVGFTIRFNNTSFINQFGHGLHEELPKDVCVDPVSDIDFCNRSYDLKGIDIGSWVITLGSIFILTGFIVVVLSILGFVASIKQFKALLVMMIIFICAAIGMEAYIIDIVTNEESSFHAEAKEELILKLQANYELAEPEENSFTQAMNVIMMQAECCGIEGRDDFSKNLTFKREDGFVYFFQNPPACCLRELLKLKKYKAFVYTHGCLNKPNEMLELPKINEQGCYLRMFEYIFDSYGYASYTLLICLIVWHIIDVVLAVIIIIMRPSEHSGLKNFTIKESTALGLRITSLHNTLSQGKFMPFAKTSSKTSLRRSKSTEIW